MNILPIFKFYDMGQFEQRILPLMLHGHWFYFIMNNLKKSVIFFAVFIITVFHFTTILHAADLSLTKEENTWIAEDATKELLFTKEEQAWLREHPSIRLGFNPNMQPLLIQNAAGNHTGILPDIFNQLEALTGLDINIEVGPWHSIIKQAKRGDIDGLLNCVPTLAKSTGLSTTTGFISAMPVFFGRRGAPFQTNDLIDLKGKRVAHMRAVKLLEDLIAPIKKDLTVIEVDTPLDAMTMVLEGKADIALGMNFDNYLLSQSFLNGIEPVLIDTSHLVRSVTGIRSDWPELVNILDKGLTKIGDRELVEVVRKWTQIETPIQNPILTESDRAWLDGHPVIRVGTDQTWGPIEFLARDGSYKGLAIDYLRKIEMLLGIEFKIVRENWQTLIDLAKNQKLDLFTCVASTPEREEYLIFTEPYVQMPAGIFAGEEAAYITDLKQIAEKKISVVEGYAITDYLAANYPDMNLVLVKTPEEGILKVKQKKAFAYIDNIITTGHLIAQKGYLDIKMAGEIQFVFAQRMGVRKDWHQFRDILQKAIDVIPDSDRNAIYNQWVPINHERSIDYSIFWKIGVACLIFICFIVFWNRRLHYQVGIKTAELLSSEKRLKAIFNHRFQLTGLLAPDGKLLMANENVCRLVEVDFKEIEGKYLWELPHWSHSEELQRQIQNSVEIAKKGNPVNIETTHPDSEGTIRAIDFHLTPVRDENGEVIFIVPEGHDISERKKVEEALRESEEKYRTFFQNSYDAMLMIKDDLFFDCNTAAVTALGYHKIEEVLNISPSDVSPKYQPDGKESSIKAKEMIETAYAQGTHRFEWEHMRKNGEVFPVEVSLTAIPYEGQMILLTVWIDISKRKKAEAEKELMQKQLSQSQKMEAIGTLSGGIAHDFNNILSAIFGYSEIALSEISKESQLYSYLDKVLTAGCRAKKLVEQILTFSRKQDRELKPLKISLIVKETLQLLRSSIPTTIEIKSDINPNCEPVLADPTQIQQIVMNLCTNAYHAMKLKGGVLTINLKPIARRYNDNLSGSIFLKPGSYLELEVRDTGHGISEENLEKIFDPYFTTKEKGEGTGLGLSIIHSIIKDYGGNIEVKSNIGKGSSFLVYLPVIKEESLSDDSKKELDSLPPGDERILFVDDEKAVVDFNEIMLKSLGYKVKGFTNSLKAYEAFKNKPNDFDMLITDMTMPNLTGEELIQRIHERRPELPVLLCSGYSDFLTAENAEKIGANAYLEKPILMKDLAIKIRKIFDLE